jgi:hypothetical protein
MPIDTTVSPPVFVAMFRRGRTLYLLKDWLTQRSITIWLLFLLSPPGSMPTILNSFLREILPRESENWDFLHLNRAPSVQNKYAH